MTRKTRNRSESVTYNGVVFRRYPDSPRRELRCYYTPGGTQRTKGVRRLHEEIWISTHGCIPAGFHVHHVDGNPLNNDISNLECISPKKHAAAHARPADEKRRAHMAKIRPLATEWHRSSEGRRWHKENGVRSWVGRRGAMVRCVECGSDYECMARLAKASFCSKACKARARRRSGVDDIERQCLFCGKTFRVNRYARNVHCSLSCAVRRRRSTEA
jgi:hypothetical protein